MRATRRCKNIARPVRVYRLRLEPGPAPAPSRPRRRRLGRALGAAVVIAVLGAGGWAGWRRLGASTSSALPLPDRPSVAVLPFTNLSQDPSQAYFSDGVTEDLITALSKVSGLFVIARNSTFVYKDRPVKIRDVGRELGVRYVVEGGVQRAGDRVRITVQLVDAATGYHVWAERYDRDFRDIFALQDEVTTRIVRSLAVRLSEAERARMTRPPPGDLAAYDLVLRGQEARHRATREENAEARRLFVKALDLDPDYAAASVGLGWTLLQSWQMLWSPDPGTLQRARELGERAVALDDTLAQAHCLLAQVYLWRKDHDRALAEAERAIALAPNDADGYETRAEVLGWGGRPQESRASIEQAMRLNPHYPYFYLWTLGHAEYLAGRRREALDTFDKLVQANPDFLGAHAYRAAVLTELRREGEAQQAWHTASRLSPGVTLAALRERLPYRRPADLERVLAAVRTSGLR